MVHTLSYSENNIIGLIILLVIFLNIRSKHKKLRCDDKLYLALIVSNSLIMILNIIINTMDGKLGFLFRETNIFLTTIYFILNPIPYMAWSLYVDFYIHRDVKRLKKITPLASIPAVISMVLTLASLFTNAVFIIDKNNVYNRGKLFWMIAVLYYSYFVVTYIQIIINRDNVRKKDYYSLLTFAILPAITGILQLKNMGQSYIWLSVSISSLIIFINIQNNEINKDYLTGLYNRRQLDRYLKACIREMKAGELLLMIMMDINYFKNINDTYGHIEGDEALRHMSDILNYSFRAEDFISRYAGDEFVVIIRLEDEMCMKPIIDRLKSNFDKFNESDITPYDLDVSIGYDIYNPELKMGADDFIMHTDDLMYKDKKRMKEGCLN